MGEAVLHSINPELVDMGANLKHKISEIVNPDADEIPLRRTFISHTRHLKAPVELIADLWCIGLKKYQETLSDTTKRGVRSSTLTIEQRYRSNRVFKIIHINESFATENLFWMLNH